MRKYYNKAKTLAVSGTAKDTVILFSGNFINAGLGFVYTWLVARALSVNDFGVFSAVNNLIYIIIPLTDLGTTSGLIRFVAELDSKGKHAEAMKFVKSAFVIKLVVFTLSSLIIVIFADPVARKLLATENKEASYWAIIISIGMFLSSFIPSVLYAKKEFLKSALVDVSYGFGRVAFILPLLIGGLTLTEAYTSFAAAGIVSFIVIFFVSGYSFLNSQPTKKTYHDLLAFSGWLGINRLISTIASRVDVQLLALMASASAIGYYAIANRLAFFISFLAASYSSVIAPRLSSYGDPKAEITYLKKTTLALIPVSIGIIFWVIIARPFVLIFGEQYLPAVNVFRILALAMIPFLFTAPSVSAIIYAIKKPKYIGMFSVIQLIIVVALNIVLIPRIGVYSPPLVFGVVHILLLIYSWVIVINHYRKK